jgi:hypothetical protein
MLGRSAIPCAVVEQAWIGRLALVVEQQPFAQRKAETLLGREHPHLNGRGGFLIQLGLDAHN